MLTERLPLGVIGPISQTVGSIGLTPVVGFAAPAGAIAAIPIVTPKASRTDAFIFSPPTA
jgi:hypothetical protein